MSKSEPSRILARPVHRGALLGAVLALLTIATVPAPADAACSASCTETACSADCTEAEIRDAVAKANDCVGAPAWTGRTITIEGPACDLDPTISMLNDDAAETAHPNSSCPGDPEEHAVCLKNDDIHLLGSGVTFIYDGVDACGQCAGACPTGAGLFTLKGHRNTVENFSFRYFPEGIHIREGDGHTIRNVDSDRICEDAFTIDKTAGTGLTIRDSILTGQQAPDAGRTCILSNGSEGACGTDKAVQVNGGGSTILGNTIDMIGQPISIGAGTHRVEGNSSTGSTADQNVCQAYTIKTGAVATLIDNTIDHCKFGIRVESGALVIAESNTITSPWVSAFNLRGAGRLKGQDNRLKTRTGGFTSLSDAQHGLVVARDNSEARVDLGGGDFAGVSVVDDTACDSGGDCSNGGNRFCSDGGGFQADIWNVTDCPCLDLLCDGIPGSCTVHSCAPLAADGTCAGTGGSDASIGARDNCFAGDGGTPSVFDTGAGSTATTGATECAPADCVF